ncbi:uncharacterized transposon-derived [Paramuricea clavata]|uniref:Uncharacterized transposon-derived n=1 Tax=Paramuricea clavata TaxID=317549 RepID=A0A7D9EJ60_PARCT|nr:uncharacterized transposon-derived [Paramuricea clavata]
MGYGLGGVFSALTRSSISLLKAGVKAGVKNLARRSVPMLKAGAKAGAKSLARKSVPLLKAGARSLGKAALRSGTDFLEDVLSGSSVKASAKARSSEAIRGEKRKARNKLTGQSGRGRKRTKRSKSVRRTAKKRKASASTTRRRPTKKRKTAHDIFGTEDYVDLSKTILVIRDKVTKANGNNLDADEKVGVVNNFLHSLFKQVDVFLKEKQVTQATGTYAYRAYLETILNYGPAAKESQLTSALYYKDMAGKMDAANPTIAAPNHNAGLKTRYTFSKEGGIIEMVGPIFSDIFMTERLLLSYVDLKITLNRNNEKFCLMASENGADFRVKLMDASLRLRKVKTNPTVSVAREIALKKGPAIYPIRRVECKSFIVPAGNPSLKKDNLFNGLVPKHLSLVWSRVKRLMVPTRKIRTTSSTLV